MEKLEIKKEHYITALVRLQKALDINKPDDLQIDAIIYRFKFTFDLAWKTIKKYLYYKGFKENIYGPRRAIQTGFKEGIIKDGDSWIEMMEDRNLTSHLCHYDKSRKIYDRIKNKYIKLLLELKERLKGEI